MYVYTNQHGNGAQSPYYKGEMLYCLNATTGKEIWSEEFQGGDNGGPGYPIGVVASGEYVNYNMYDNQVYAFGQGPSKTTVNAPDIGVTTATPITITGSVTDISAGTTQTQQAADFPNGVPCVSDASESQWMEYVYMQQPEPSKRTGVPVTLYVLDSNNNYRSIGTTTTNAQATFIHVDARHHRQLHPIRNFRRHTFILWIFGIHRILRQRSSTHSRSNSYTTDRLSLKHNPHVRSCRHNHRDSHHRRSNSTGTHQKTAISQRRKK